MKPIIFSVVCILALLVSSQNPGQLNGLATGSIYLATNDLANAASSKSYTVNFNGNLGNTSLAYALGTAKITQL